MLLKQGVQDVPTWQDWSAKQSAGNKVVAIDPQLISASTARKLAEKIEMSGGRHLRALEQNLVDLVWGQDRPERPVNPVMHLPEKFAGKDVNTKLTELRRQMKQRDSAALVVSMLDEIAWLFNLRGSDIPYNPVFFAYAIITLDSAILFIDSTRLSREARTHLDRDGVLVKPYEHIFDAASKLQATCSEVSDGSDSARKRIIVSNKGSWALKRALGGEAFVDEIRSPIEDSKAVKNETEMAGMTACHIRDGAAVIQYLAWLENQLVAKEVTLDEIQAAEKLEEFRAKREYYVGLSFDTISSSGAK